MTRLLVDLGPLFPAVESMRPLLITRLNILRWVFFAKTGGIDGHSKNAADIRQPDAGHRQRTEGAARGSRNSTPELPLNPLTLIR